MLIKKDEGMKPAEKKKKTVTTKGMRLNPQSAKLGIIYAEVLGRPVSKKRGFR